MKLLRARLARMDRARLDALLTVAIIAELELEIWLDGTVPRSHRPLTAVAAVLFVAPLAVRRRWAGPALVGSSALATLQGLLGGRLDATSGLGMMFALVLLAYAAGAWLDLRGGAIALVLGAVVFSGFVLRAGGTTGIATILIFVGLVFAAPWFIGRLTRERDRRIVAFRALALQADAEREQRRRAAIAEERLRIGRELQDIIADNVTAMVAQAGGARQLVRTHPEQARAMILTVEQTGREALGDLRRVLGMLRHDDDPRALAPQPGLDQLPVLLDSLRQSGCDCHLRVDGEPVDLTPGIDLVGYRVVEAALRTATDAGCRRAAVAVGYRLGDLELEVTSDESIPDLAQALEGIADRVALYGGSLQLDSTDGFVVRARLPMLAMATA
jgi:signal transduction histidine kinase